VGLLRIVMVVIGVGIGVVLPASGSAAVLYRTPNVIVASTAASGRLAWIEANHSFTCARVYRRSVPATSRVRLTTCRKFNDGLFPWVRLVGARVYWDERSPSPPSDSVRTIVATGHGKAVGHWSLPCTPIGCTPNSTGEQLGPVAVGDGALFYTVRDWSFDPSGNGSVVGGSVRRAVTSGGGVQHFTVAGAPVATLLDQADKRILEVPCITPSNAITPSQILQLRHDRSGKLAWSITFTSTARAVALSGDYAITLVTPPTGGVHMRIRAYDARTGTLIRSLVVNSRVREIGIAGPRVVFADPRRVMLWNVRHNLLHQFQHTNAAFPENPTISGRLVTWLQATPYQSTIHGVVLPALKP
jgi:hypothetical protein